MSGTRVDFETPIEDAISRLRFSPNSNNLLLSSWDSYLRLYNVDTSSLIAKLYSESPLLDCCFQNESTSYSSASDGFIRRYDLNTSTINTIGRHVDIATSVLYSSQQGVVISSGLDDKIKLWDTSQRESLVFSIDGGSAVRCIALSGSSELLVFLDASVCVYDLRNVDLPFQSYASQVEVPIRCVTSLPHSTGYAVGSVDGQVALDFHNTLSSSEIKYTFRCHPKSRNGRVNGVCINAIEFSPCGSGTFVTGDNEGYVISWNATSRRRLLELPRYSNSISSLAFNNTGEVLAVASSQTYQEAIEKEAPPDVFILDTQAASKVSSHVAIIAVGAEVARSNIDGLYQFAALLNNNLAAINLLPLPALDGGTLALILLEVVRGGRKLPLVVEQGIRS